jgi:hypothetical protein
MRKKFSKKMRNWMCIFCYAGKWGCIILRKFKVEKPNTRRKTNLPALMMSPLHAEFMMQHTYGKIAQIASSTNKRRKNTGRRTQRSLKNRMKLESTPCLIQITRRHQLSKSKPTLNMMKTTISWTIKQCAPSVEVLDDKHLRPWGVYPMLDDKIHEKPLNATSFIYLNQ